MSDFIFIIPSGWVQLDWLDLSNNGILTASVANDPAASMFTLDEVLKNYGAIPWDSSLQEIKVFNDEICIVRLG
jgi:hypothetical protein